ncbi:MAG TPA: hypothetical protein VKY26_06890, partial [Actinomycetota bacterium]|nr:hypothetical protein [Actinomycetota bacterium]
FAIDDDEILLIVEPGQPAKVTTGHEDDHRHDLTVQVTGTVDQLQRLLGGDPSGVTIDGDPAPLLNLLDAAGPL